MDRAVLAIATELFEGRHYPSVVALVSDALGAAPEQVDLLLIRARAQLVLRADLEAQADLRDIIRLDPRCHHAYRLLGELAARKDEHEAAIFFREALRLDPSDEGASAWLAIVELSTGRFARASIPPPAEVVEVDEDIDDSDYDETQERTPVQAAAASTRYAAGSSPALPSYDRYARAVTVRELPGFGDYLVAMGLLTMERLRAAQTYQRSMGVQLSTAIVTLGLASPQRVEWAAVAHQASVSGSRQ